MSAIGCSPGLRRGGALLLTAAAVVATAAPAHLPHGASQAFVHLFEWSWDDIAQECEDWLGPHGFAAVQVSPPTEHIQGPEWWTRYQPVTYNLTSRSGDEAAFATMVQRCRKAGVAIYVDAVTNHLAGGSGVGTAGSPYGNRSFPLYSPADFHHAKDDPLSNCLVDNYADRQNVQFCDLLGLPDLCTECEHVQAMLAEYLGRLADLGVAGIRIDAAKHQSARELRRVLERARGGLWSFSEVIDSDGEPISPKEYSSFSEVTEFKYGYDLDEVFRRESLLGGLEGFGEPWGLLPGSNAIAFVDNHDTQRSGDPKQLTYKSGPVYNLAVAFMLAFPYGYPQLMSSFRFSGFDDAPPSVPVHGPGGALRCGDGEPWICEHRRPEIANMVAWRRVAGDSEVTHFKPGLDGNAVLFCRGDLSCIALNRDDSVEWVLEGAELSMPPGRYCDVFVSSSAEDCPFVDLSQPKVGTGSRATLHVPPMSAVALHVNALHGGDFKDVQRHRRLRAGVEPAG